jgi:antitoxin (DNA-binding transcriptional repressor) of toxin-antitoxin stability system
MTTIEIAKATAPLADYARDVGAQPVVVMEGGKPVAAVVSMRNVDSESFALSTDPRFIAMLERSRARQKAEGDISLEEARRRLKAKR